MITNYIVVCANLLSTRLCELLILRRLTVGVRRDVLQTQRADGTVRPIIWSIAIV